MGPNEAVLKYLTDQNRPYSVNDIMMNLHKEYGKTAVQKALDYLVEHGKIKEKVYGKQKVYAVEQVDSSGSLDMSRELEELDTVIAKLTADIQSVEQELKTSDTLLKDLLSTPTTENAVNELSSLEKRVEKLRSKLNDLSKNTKPISSEEREQVYKLHSQHIGAWKKRKRLCVDMVNSILEGYPKDKKCLLEEVGIETDEDAGVIVPIRSS